MQHLNIETVIDYLHGELPPGEDASVFAHLEECATCTSELNREASLTEALRTAARAEELELPLGMKSAILARAAAETPGPLERFTRWLRPVVLVPLAGVAALAVGAFLIPALEHSSPVLPPSATLPVSYLLEEHAAHARENPLSDRSAAAMMTASTGSTATTASASTATGSSAASTTMASFERDAGARDAGGGTLPLVQSADAALLADDGAR